MALGAVRVVVGERLFKDLRIHAGSLGKPFDRVGLLQHAEVVVAADHLGLGVEIGVEDEPGVAAGLLEDRVGGAVAGREFVDKARARFVDHDGADAADRFTDENAASLADGRVGLDPVDVGHARAGFKCHAHAVAGARDVVRACHALEGRTIEGHHLLVLAVAASSEHDRFGVDAVEAAVLAFDHDAPDGVVFVNNEPDGAGVEACGHAVLLGLSAQSLDDVRTDRLAARRAMRAVDAGAARALHF